MAVSLYLAMTAAEIQQADSLPENLAYMACHFSPYGLGLSNRPTSLKAGSVLILNDRTPISGHDPALIARQLLELISDFHCDSVLLDFQRPDCDQTMTLCRQLTAEAPCPVVVSDLYAKELSCPVFLSPPPLNMPLKEHLAPWQGRNIWLEAALEAACICVTAEGSRYTDLPHTPMPDHCFADTNLHCHYRQEVSPQEIRFYLYRAEKDLQDLLQEAQNLGVSRAVGLYQQRIGI